MKTVQMTKSAIALHQPLIEQAEDLKANATDKAIYNQLKAAISGAHCAMSRPAESAEKFLAWHEIKMQNLHLAINAATQKKGETT